MKRVLTICLAVAITTATSQVVSGQGFPATEQHQLLKKDVGTWHAAGKMWMPGVEEPMEFEGTEVNKMVGELWVYTDFHGEVGGVEFHGHGRSGFNIETEKYEATWFDSMQPFVMTMSGTYDAESETMNSMSDGRDDMGNPKKGKSTLHYKDENTRVMTMYAASPDGGDEWVKEMEIIYTRKD